MATLFSANDFAIRNPVMNLIDRHVDGLFANYVTSQQLSGVAAMQKDDHDQRDLKYSATSPTGFLQSVRFTGIDCSGEMTTYFHTFGECVANNDKSAWFIEKYITSIGRDDTVTMTTQMYYDPSCTQVKGPPTSTTTNPLNSAMGAMKIKRCGNVPPESQSKVGNAQSLQLVSITSYLPRPSGSGMFNVVYRTVSDCNQKTNAYYAFTENVDPSSPSPSESTCIEAFQTDGSKVASSSCRFASDVVPSCAAIGPAPIASFTSTPKGYLKARAFLDASCTGALMTMVVAYGMCELSYKGIPGVSSYTKTFSAATGGFQMWIQPFSDSACTTNVGDSLTTSVTIPLGKCSAMDSTDSFFMIIDGLSSKMPSVDHNAILSSEYQSSKNCNDRQNPTMSLFQNLQICNPIHNSSYRSTSSCTSTSASTTVYTDTACSTVALKVPMPFLRSCSFQGQAAGYTSDSNIGLYKSYECYSAPPSPASAGNKNVMDFMDVRIIGGAVGGVLALVIIVAVAYYSCSNVGRGSSTPNDDPQSYPQQEPISHHEMRRSSETMDQYRKSVKHTSLSGGAPQFNPMQAAPNFAPPGMGHPEIGSPGMGMAPPSMGSVRLDPRYGNM